MTPKNMLDDVPLVSYEFPLASKNPKQSVTALITVKIPYPIK